MGRKWPKNLFSVSCDLDLMTFDLLHPSCVAVGTCCNMCLPGLVKFHRTVLETSLRKIYLIFTFDVLTPKMIVSCRCFVIHLLVPICTKVDFNLVHKFGNRRTNGRPDIIKQCEFDDTV